ncbi:MAG: hypothetical protein HQK81_13170, partial [Desulfovibrionaceae bacterium]|nr:hypothetical protein [Desulfovibrionaceae bacterium]
VAGLRAMAGKIDDAQTAAVKAAAGFDSARAAIAARLRDIGACPLCGGVLDAEHFFGAAGAAGATGAIGSIGHDPQGGAA